MTSKAFLYFLLGATISSVSYALLFFSFQLLTFNLAGGETLATMRAQRGTLLILTLLLSIIFLRFAIKWIRGTRRSKGFGVLLVMMVSAILAIGYVWDLYRYEHFNKEAWLRSPVKSFRMAAGLAADGKILGKTRTEIKELLGKGSQEYENVAAKNGVITYYLTKEWTMQLYFENNVLHSIAIRKPSMMT